LSYLLDSNVLSETVKPKPSPDVVQWFASVDEQDLFMSVVTLAEIRDGIEVMPAGKRRELLDRWLSVDLPERFHGRMLDIDMPTAITCGRVMARTQKSGRAVDVMDAFIAATALRHNLALVTRNIADFQNLDVELINPWNS